MSCGERRYSAGSVALSFLLGGAVGAGLAILLTPQSGPEARRKIRSQADTVREEALKVTEGFRTKAEDIVEKSKEMVKEKKNIIESAVEAGKEAMEREKERIMTKLQKESEETS
ncbi:MAG TPA: YtxH domain-containing protein [Thermodesulfobacteriaceae bacterium]|nr:YtxH domain-containing protein [Thermodesulfobacteriaceae bacterium]